MISKLVYWPLSAIDFAWAVSRYGSVTFWWALRWVIKEMFRRAGSRLILEPLELLVWVLTFVVGLAITVMIGLWIMLEILAALGVLR